MEGQDQPEVIQDRRAQSAGNPHTAITDPSNRWFRAIFSRRRYTDSGSLPLRDNTSTLITVKSGLCSEKNIGAGGGSRTLLSCLGSTHNTDILRPQRTSGLKPTDRPAASHDSRFCHRRRGFTPRQRALTASHRGVKPLPQFGIPTDLTYISAGRRGSSSK